MPKYDPQQQHRHTIRLQGYDYCQPGAYFVTLCTQNRECVLGEIANGQINYSATGLIAHDFWAEVGAHFPQVEVPSFVSMPNHVHAMIVIRDIPPGAKGVVWKPRAYSGIPSTGRGVVTTPLPGQGDTGQGKDTVTTPQPGQGDTGQGKDTVFTPLPGQGDTGRGDPAPTERKPDLGHIVAFYKYQTTKRINAQGGNPGCRSWQRNYFEHIVRNDDEFWRVIEYIQTNPLRWESDQLHPAAGPNPFNQD